MIKTSERMNFIIAAV